MLTGLEGVKNPENLADVICERPQSFLALAVPSANATPAATFNFFVGLAKFSYANHPKHSASNVIAL